MLAVVESVKPSWCLFENVVGFKNMELDTMLAKMETIGYTTGQTIIPACSVNAPHRRSRIFIIGHRNWNVAHSDTKRHTPKPRPGETGEAAHYGSSGTGTHTNEDVADSEIIGSGKSRESSQEKGDCESIPTQSDMCSADVADSEIIGIQGSGTLGEQESGTHGRAELSLRDSTKSGRGDRPTQRGMGGVIDGLSEGIHGDFNKWQCGWEVGTPRVIEGQKTRAERLKQLGNSIVPPLVEVIAVSILEIEKGLRND